MLLEAGNIPWARHDFAYIRMNETCVEIAYIYLDPRLQNGCILQL